jgi:hypothetical protein
LVRNTRNIILTLICSLSFIAFSQDALLHEKGLDQLTKLSFNKTLIIKNKVRSITTEYMYKKELSPIVKNPKRTIYYEFNDSGQLLMYYKTFQLYDTVYDTLVEFYSYNKLGQLKELRRSEYGKFGVYTYLYDNNKVVAVSQAEEENLTNSKLHFIPKNHNQKYTEKYVYETLDDLSYMKYTLSHDGVRYKEEEVVYKNSKIKKEKTRYLFSKQKYNVYNYYYFDNDLVKKEEVDNYSSKQKKAFVYRYDNKKRVTQMETFKENENLYLTEFLYKENTELLDATINKNNNTKAIEIIKYKYSYYKK